MRESLRLDLPTMAMDRRVCAAWKLNDELLDLIATKLHVPLQTLFQLRCVSKTWSTVLADDHFLRRFFLLLSQTPLYIAEVRGMDGDLAACDTGIKDWHKWKSAFHSNHFSLYSVCGGVGDWLLVRKSEGPYEDLFVANPTKRVFKKLPSFPEGCGHGLYAMGMGLDESSKSCKVFAVTHVDVDVDVHKAYSYDFELESWKAFGVWEFIDFEVRYNMTFYKGTLHRLTCKSHEGHGICHLCSYDERESCWQLSAQIPEGLRFKHLFQWQGHLMLIGGRKGEHDIVQHHDPDDYSPTPPDSSIHIWQLDQEKQIWVESMRMPNHMLDYLTYPFYAPESHLVYDFGIGCATCNDQICFTSEATIVKDNTAGPTSRKRNVMCDLSKALWWEIPEPSFDYQDPFRFSILIPNSAFES